MNFSKIKIENELFELYGSKIHHFRNNEEWKISVFFFCDDYKSISQNWENVSSSIAAVYQSDTFSNSKNSEFEIWNIYILYVSSDMISKELKNKIENNRFSSRKIVEDNFLNVLTDVTANDMIVKHITNTDLKKIIDETNTSVQKKYTPINSKLWNLIPNDESISGNTVKQKEIIDSLKKL